MLSLLLLHHSELVVLLLDLVYSVSILLAEELMLVTLDSLGRWLDVTVVRALREFRVFDDHVGLRDWVPLHILVHRLVVLVNLVVVAESRKHFLFNDRLHAGSQLIFEWVQKGKLGLLLLLGEGAHSNQLFEKPLVHLSQLPQLHVHVPLIDHLDHQFAEALVQFYSVLVGKA